MDYEHANGVQLVKLLFCHVELTDVRGVGAVCSTQAHNKHVHVCTLRRLCRNRNCRQNR